MSRLHLATKKLALMCIFSALYAVFSMMSLFPIIGALGRFITLAAVLAPVLGILLGPYIGSVAASIGGFVGWTITQSGAFGFVSFIPGAASAFVAGLLTIGKRGISVIFYLLLLSAMAFFPIIGPVWLYPLYIWFQLVGLIILVSPASCMASRFIRSMKAQKSALGIGIIALIATLAGQVTGTLMFEIFVFPVSSNIEFWRTTQWLPVAFVYPLERSIVTLLAILAGTPLIKAIRTYGFEIGGT